MPSRKPLPTIAELVKAFHDGIRGQRLATEDKRDGSAYDYIAGPTAILWRQQAQRDQDMARSGYFDDADGQDLSDRGLSLFRIPRIVDTYGTGTAIFTRTSTAAGAGTFWPGTRIRANGATANITTSTYAVTTRVDVSASALTVTLPVRATTFGGGVSIVTPNASIEDPLWDNSWTAQSLICANGTVFEKAADYRARVRALQFKNRVGFRDGIITACQNAGAGAVAAFAPNFAGDANDFGICATYIGDGNYTGTTTLVRATILALESVRVFGADMLVGAMMPVPTSIVATVYLWDDPARIETTQLQTAITNAAVREFSETGNGFAYSRDAIGGAMRLASPLVQSVAFTTPSSDATIMTGSPPSFPVTLNRYTLAPQNVAITFAGPQ